jgi:DUF4097 and DUF4098 domain-containing protein YvlB
MRTATASLLLIAALVAAPTEAAVERQETVRAGKARSVSVENLVGAVQVLPATGRELTIEFKVVADGDDAQALADSISFVTRDQDGRLEVTVEYPTDRHRSYRYQAGRSHHETQTDYRGHRVRVSSRSGVALHVDAVVRVPEGGALRFANQVGEVTAERVVGDLDIDTGAGAVESRGGRGTLKADTGSGGVRVRDHRGPVSADTGSGGVVLDDVQGDVEADTGSGGIRLTRVVGERLRLDSGSGGIELEDSRGSLDADTGSGGVRTRGFTAGERVRVDSGSGRVVLDGDLSAVRELEVDTGSGGATIVSSAPLDLRLHIEVGSGRIEVDAPDMRDVEHEERDTFDAVLGSGRGRAVIDTGSGGVSVRVAGR